MAWKVMSSVICPNTGIVYTAIVGMKFLKMIIWYESNVFLRAGDIIKPSKNGMIINGVHQSLIVYNVSPFNATLWKEIEDKMTCPFNKQVENTVCTYSLHCRAKKCPHGFMTNPLALNIRDVKH
ncbi:TPA: lycopene biosynthesis protein [Enterobacter chengduensis]|nr:lycopene biosynthesis protein [Enterobacter chengduensis]